MAKPQSVFEYTYETVNKLSDWPAGRLYKDQSVGDVDMERLESVVVWLAKNGTPELRGKIAAAILPDFLGMRPRPVGVNEQLQEQASPELLRLAFQRVDKPRKTLAKLRGTKS